MPEDTAELRHSRVVFTGKLASMPRAQAWGAVRSKGGTPEKAVTRRTSLVVVGMEGWPLLPDGTLSRKLQRADALAAEGYPIEIVPEAAFLERIGFAPAREQLRKTLSPEQVRVALGLDLAALRQWELLGLVRPVEGRYDFLDVASLRTLADLVGRGVEAGTISASLWRLRAVFPELDRPLAQLSILANEARALLVRTGELVLEPDGQLIFGFEVPGTERPADGSGVIGAIAGASGSGAARPALSGEEWFERGQRLEDQERYDEAAAAYRAAVGACGRFSEALFNLGNCLRSAGRGEAAEEAYRLCLAQEPGMAEGWYNLADVLDEAGRVGDAIECLRRAVQVWPGFADAHFNLAVCLEKQGQRDEAAGHWRTYLEIDPESRWAVIARRRLAGQEVARGCGEYGAN